MYVLRSITKPPSCMLVCFEVRIVSRSLYVDKWQSMEEFQLSVGLFIPMRFKVFIELIQR